MFFFYISRSNENFQLDYEEKVDFFLSPIRQLKCKLIWGKHRARFADFVLAFKNSVFTQ